MGFRKLSDEQIESLSSTYREFSLDKKEDVKRRIRNMKTIRAKEMLELIAEVEHDDFIGEILDDTI